MTEDFITRKSEDIVRVYGPDQSVPGLWRVRLRDGTITSISTANTSATIIESTVIEFGEMFDRLANK